ncbi:hypothetical protein ABPG72_017000 [Tetrahymena utriculariae]
MDFQQKIFYVKIRLELGHNATQIHEDLVNSFIEDSPSFLFVSKWVRYFKEDYDSVQDAPRSGRPSIVFILENINEIRAMVTEDPYISIREIFERLQISYGTVQSIFSEKLNLRKLSNRFVPHQFTQKNKEQRFSLCQENLKNIRLGIYKIGDIITGNESWFFLRQIKNKSMNYCWRSVNGWISFTQVNKGETLNHKNYIEDCLKPMVSELKIQRPVTDTKNQLFHHDNARPHSHSLVSTYLEDEGFILMKHPPYSHDLASADSWLFDKIKRQLSDENNYDSLFNEVEDILNKIPQRGCSRAFEKWQQRMQMCIDKNGDYFEYDL